MIMRIHDLLKINAQAFVEGNASPPSWVVEALEAVPFVVVRREIVAPGLIAVGVRGEARSQRWAGTCEPGWINGVVTPAELMSVVLPDLTSTTSVRSAPSAGRPRADSNGLGRDPDSVPLQSRFGTIPAFRSLALLTGNQTWSSLPYAWGPGGSVGFELATGHPTASLQSDLDLVIYANDRLSVAEAKSLHTAAQNLPSVVDVRVETPVCGFSLTEYARQAAGPILLRTVSGVMLGTDPWDPDPSQGSPRADATDPPSTGSNASSP